MENQRSRVKITRPLSCLPLKKLRSLPEIGKRITHEFKGSRRKTRIVLTFDMNATRTDVKQLECLVFSAILIQMHNKMKSAGFIYELGPEL